MGTGPTNLGRDEDGTESLAFLAVSATTPPWLVPVFTLSLAACNANNSGVWYIKLEKAVKPPAPSARLIAILRMACRL